jgi:hypothetical protein
MFLEFPFPSLVRRETVPDTNLCQRGQFLFDKGDVEGLECVDDKGEEETAGDKGEGGDGRHGQHASKEAREGIDSGRKYICCQQMTRTVSMHPILGLCHAP